MRARVAAQAAGGAAGRAVALGTCASQGERLPRRGSWLGVLLAVTRVTGIQSVAEAASEARLIRDLYFLQWAVFGKAQLVLVAREICSSREQFL